VQRIKPSQAHAVTAGVVSILALLLIFIGSLHDPSTGIEIIPANVSNKDCDEGDPVVLFISSTRGLVLDHMTVESTELETWLARRLRTKANKIVWVHAAPDLRFEAVAHFLDRIRGQGWSIALLPSHRVPAAGPFNCVHLGAPSWL
jgi:biopolymer transport protein ExbD